MLAGLGAAGTDAFAWAPRRVQLTRHEVLVPSLAEELEGFRIAHLSDIHLYDGLHLAARRAIELVREVDPDLTLVTGDLAENTGQLPEIEALLREVRGRRATIVTMGNWEHAVGITPDMLGRSSRAAGATFLLNETWTEALGAARLAVVGLDDPLAGKPDPDAALRELPAGAFAIWAFHAPGFADRLRATSLPRPALALTGHTHGGQIRPPFVPPITPPGSGRFVAGWYRDSFAPLYVSRGIGTTAVRARFRCPPEMAVFVLRSAVSRQPSADSR
jgi:predicted MPP superfamily phosphohydrolase